MVSHQTAIKSRMMSKWANEWVVRRHSLSYFHSWFYTFTAACARKKERGYDESLSLDPWLRMCDIEENSFFCCRDWSEHKQKYRERQLSSWVRSSLSSWDKNTNEAWLFSLLLPSRTALLPSDVIHSALPLTLPSTTQFKILVCINLSAYAHGKKM